MTRVALGYLAKESLLPSNLSLYAASDIFIVAGHKGLCESVTARLFALQACFDSGLDVLPFALRTRVSLDVAQSCVRPNEMALKAALQKIRGCGQISLSLRKVRTDLSLESEGRGWLAGRLSDFTNNEKDRHWLQQIVMSIGYPVSELVETPKSFTIGCLVSRQDVRSVIDILHANLASSGDVELLIPRLTVSGLWPALGFADLKIHLPAEAA